MEMGHHGDGACYRPLHDRPGPRLPYLSCRRLGKEAEAPSAAFIISVRRSHQKGADLVGWRIKATFPTGPDQDLRWHDGFVTEHCEKEVGNATIFCYRLYIPVDSGDEWVQPPFNDKSLCFRKAHLPDVKATAGELRSAKAAIDFDRIVEGVDDE